ncbi:unnamed protein product [Parnassius apollo]|uniref:(apollo) hypothetical protein n=1 Tax=Parnassius apollo TaxID=110799 RepID=A0A8S3W4M0_PARAO|nr:unnamed protein product [Parnassius apollo]
MQQKNSFMHPKFNQKKSNNENENASTGEDTSGDVPDVNVLSTSNQQIQEDSSEIQFFNQAVKNRKASNTTHFINTFLSVVTILDPRFKRIHFNSPIAVSNAISKISDDIRSEYRRRGQRSPDVRSDRATSEKANESSIWCRHEQLLNLRTAAQEVPSSGSVPNELKQYLDQPLLERKSDPIKFWVNCRHFTPVLSDIALKYLICQASSVSSERVASIVNLTVPDNRSRLTGEHIKERVLLMSISDEYWYQ